MIRKWVASAIFLCTRCRRRTAAASLASLSLEMGCRSRRALLIPRQECMGSNLERSEQHNAIGAARWRFAVGGETD
eukprot:6181944-Pleurochrysis_carterae.AAC.4